MCASRARLAEVSERGFGGGFHLVFIGDVHLEGRSFAASGYDLGDNLREFFFIARGASNSGAGLREDESAGASDTL